MCVCVCVCITVLLITACVLLLHSAACTFVLHVPSAYTLGPAAYPSAKVVVSLRRHTKVLADGERRFG